MEEQDAGAAPQQTARHGTAPRDAAPQDTVPQPATGDPRVDEAVGRLGELAGLPAEQHPAVFEHVHRRLAEVLGELGQDTAGH
ncbi:MAG: hypothetical protein J2P34_01475 [Actinobacteria bacterium]|nr:hypothetical protein [Actinomycetota bacterium]